MTNKDYPKFWGGQIRCNMGDVQVAYIEYVQTYRVWGGREDRGLKFLTATDN